MEKLNRIGSWTAIQIGLPIGIVFSCIILYISLFPILDLVIASLGGRLFWHPLVFGGIIPIAFAILLWIAGSKIHYWIESNYSATKISFIFTIYVNVRLFGLLLAIFFVSGISNFELGFNHLAHKLISATVVVFITFIILTIITTFSIGKLIVSRTKKKINS